MSELIGEEELIKSVIDLAASRRDPAPEDDWLSFDSIVEAFKEICFQLCLGQKQEQRVYSALLRMSAESERHLTWWEKLAMLQKYMPDGARSRGRGRGGQVRGRSQSPGRAVSQSQSQSQSRSQSPYAHAHLMRLVPRTVQTRPSRRSSSSPAVLEEGQHLSVLLNDTYAQHSHFYSAQQTYSAQSLAQHSAQHSQHSPHSHSSSAPSDMRHIHFQPQPQSQSQSQSQSRTNTSRDRAWDRHASTPSQLQPYPGETSTKKLDEIERELQHTRDIIGSLNLRTPPETPLDSGARGVGAGVGVGASTGVGMGTGMGAGAGAGAELRTPVGAGRASRGDWTLSPSVIHNILDMDSPYSTQPPALGGLMAGAGVQVGQGKETMHIFNTDERREQIRQSQGQGQYQAWQEYKSPAPSPIYAPAPNSASFGRASAPASAASVQVPVLGFSPKRGAKEFSQQLRSSTAMGKYLGVVGVGIPGGEAQLLTGADGDGVDAGGVGDEGDVGDVGGMGDAEAEPEAGDAESGAWSPESKSQSPYAQRLSQLRSPAAGAGSSPSYFGPDPGPSLSPSYSPTPSHSPSPSPGIGLSASGSFLRLGGSPVGVGVGMDGSASTRRLSLATELFDTEGRLDPSCLDLDPRLLGPDSSNAISATRILLIFHRWLQARSDNALYGEQIRSAPLMLHAHFCRTNDFVTSLFGLEQWLRDKIKSVVAMEVKATIFRRWNLQYGVTAAARGHWRVSRLHRGFEAVLEFGVRKRLYRRNALHALAARRRHVDVAAMRPILQHRTTSAPTSAPTSAYASTFPSASTSFLQSPKSLHDTINSTNMSLSISMLGAADRLHVKEMQYLTSLSIRAVVADVRGAILVYSRSGCRDLLRVKTTQYLAAQDSIALLFAFRRLYHRSIYIKRLRGVRLMQRHRYKTAAMALWRGQWAARTSADQALEPRILAVYQHMGVWKQRQAMRQLALNIQLMHRDREHLASYRLHVRTKSTFLRAVAILRCPALVKTFYALKGNYRTGTLPPQESYKAHLHQQAFSMRAAMRRWKGWFKYINASRLGGFKGPSQALLQTVLLDEAVGTTRDRADYHHLSAEHFLALPAVRRMHLHSRLVSRTLLLSRLRRAFHLLRRVGTSPRVFFSLMELRFAQMLARRSQPAERKKYLHLTRENSCRIPAVRLLQRRLRDSEGAWHDGGLGGCGGGGMGRESPQRRFHKSGQGQGQGQGGNHVHLHREQAAASYGPNPNHLTRPSYLPPRAFEEKPYQLIMTHPQTLVLMVRTIYNCDPFQLPQNRGWGRGVGGLGLAGGLGLVDIGGVGGGGGGGGWGGEEHSILKDALYLDSYLKEPLVKLDGTVLACTPLMLRFTQQWEHWGAVYRHERQVNLSNKRRLLSRFTNFVAVRREFGGSPHSRPRRTHRDLVARQWQRLTSKHAHHSQQRHLHAGHFYNSVLNGPQSVLSFVVNHPGVPFSLRHFLVHYPTYRFPIYAPYDEERWEHRHATPAHHALVVMAQNHHEFNHDPHHHHPQSHSHARHELFYKHAPGTGAGTGAETGAGAVYGVGSGSGSGYGVVESGLGCGGGYGAGAGPHLTQLDMTRSAGSRSRSPTRASASASTSMSVSVLSPGRGRGRGEEVEGAGYGHLAYSTPGVGRGGVGGVGDEVQRRQQGSALAKLFFNRLDCKRTKAVQRCTLRRVALNVRAAVAHTWACKRAMRSFFKAMNDHYRRSLYLRVFLSYHTRLKEAAWQKIKAFGQNLRQTYTLCVLVHTRSTLTHSLRTLSARATATQHLRRLCLHTGLSALSVESFEAAREPGSGSALLQGQGADAGAAGTARGGG
ncbi:hypothetical protein B484DRAFT_396908 [Ochromonadaceae sp. CCMP2298]|nr:hypothetical protein B484DRAFT_396908 [Ochromonadaceae sp. CCMP2298]